MKGVGLHGVTDSLAATATSESTGLDCSALTEVGATSSLEFTGLTGTATAASTAPEVVVLTGIGNNVGICGAVPPADDLSLGREIGSHGCSQLLHQMSIRTDWTFSDASVSKVLDPLDSESLGRTLTETSIVPSPHGPPTGKQLRYGVHSIRNQRSEMEDAHRVVLGSRTVPAAGDALGAGAATSDALRKTVPSVGDALDTGVTASDALRPAETHCHDSLGSFSYFAVFDGHGGSRAAEFSRECLWALIAEEQALLQTDPKSALRRAFGRLEEDWTAHARAQKFMDGTTAVVTLVDLVAGLCVVGNVGDSEAILGTRDGAGKTSFSTLTEVHHIKRSTSEAARVVAEGGRVWRDRLGHPSISPQVLSVAVSRAIGDLCFKDGELTDGKPSGLSAEPYITSAEIAADGVTEEFLLIGCDGLWDTVSYSVAADFVFARLQEKMDPWSISRKLVHLARDAGSSDNITVLLIILV